MRTEIRNTLAGVLAAGVLLLVLVPGAIRITPRYAELEGADPEVLAKLRAAWPEEGPG